MIPLIKGNHIPEICPLCGSDLHIIDALDTEAEIIIVFCRNTKNCKYCQDWNRSDLIKCR